MKLIYTSDRGDPYEVTTMQTSHLINAISHHRHQQETLAEFKHEPHILKRYYELESVVNALVRELAKREPKREEYLMEIQPPEDTEK